MKGLNDGKETTAEPFAPVGAEFSRFRRRDYQAHCFFGPSYRHPAVQRWILIDEWPSDFDRDAVEAFNRFIAPRWYPVGEVAQRYLAFLEARAKERDGFLSQGFDCGEAIDYQTGEVYQVPVEHDLGETEGSRAGECPYPGVIRGGLADRATERLRAPVDYKYRGEGSPQ